jgi:hypothetical protein
MTPGPWWCREHRGEASCETFTGTDPEGQADIVDGLDPKDHYCGSDVRVAAVKLTRQLFATDDGVAAGDAHRMEGCAAILVAHYLRSTA